MYYTESLPFWKAFFLVVVRKLVNSRMSNDE